MKKKISQLQNVLTFSSTVWTQKVWGTARFYPNHFKVWKKYIDFIVVILLSSFVFLLQVGVIDFSMYLKDGGHSSKSAEGWVNLQTNQESSL